jgi:hypothetical protein
MGNRVGFAGASGQIYSFYLLDPGRSLEPVGINYFIAERAEQAWRVLHVGESDNLAQRDWEARLAAIRREHRDAELLIRLNVSRAVRAAEAADIAAAPRATPRSSATKR